MVFSRHGAQMAAVAFLLNEEPDGRWFAEKLEEGRYYVLQNYTVGDLSRSPMKNNMVENVILDWRHPIEEVPFKKVMVNSKISQEQQGFNSEFQEAGPGRARPRQRDPGLFEKVRSLEDGQRTVDEFVTRKAHEEVVEECGDERREAGRSTNSRERRRSPRRSRSTSRERRRSPSRGRSGSREQRWSTSRRSMSREDLRRSRSKSRERSTSKASSRVSRSRTRSVSISSVKSRSSSGDRNVGLNESSEDAEEDKNEG